MPLVQAYAGTLGDEAVQAAARASGDRDDLCEADYYLGLLHQSHELLQEAAAEQCDQSDMAREALGDLRK